MKSTSLKFSLFLVISLTFISSFIKKSEKTQDLTFNNVEALADDEEEPRGYCVGVGSLDCNGGNYKYYINVE